jgi:hypothetical protein
MCVFEHLVIWYSDLSIVLTIYWRFEVGFEILKKIRSTYI